MRVSDMTATVYDTLMKNSEYDQFDINKVDNQSLDYPNSKKTALTGGFHFDYGVDHFSVTIKKEVN